MKDIIKNIFESDEQMGLDLGFVYHTWEVGEFNYRSVLANPYSLDSLLTRKLFLAFTKINDRNVLENKYWRIYSTAQRHNCSWLLLYSFGWQYFFTYMNGSGYPIGFTTLYRSNYTNAYYNNGSPVDYYEAMKSNLPPTSILLRADEEEFISYVKDIERRMKVRIPYFKR